MVRVLLGLGDVDQLATVLEANDGLEGIGHNNGAAGVLVFVPDAVVAALVGSGVGDDISAGLLDVDAPGLLAVEAVVVLGPLGAVEGVGTHGAAVDVWEGGFHSDGVDSSVGHDATWADAIFDADCAHLGGGEASGVGALVLDVTAIREGINEVDNVTHDNNGLGKVAVVGVEAGGTLVVIGLGEVSGGLDGDFVAADNLDDRVRYVGRGGGRGRGRGSGRGSSLVFKRKIGLVELVAVAVSVGESVCEMLSPALEPTHSDFETDRPNARRRRSGSKKEWSSKT